MERREFISLAALIGIIPAIGSDGSPTRLYLHKFDESRKVTPIREVGHGDYISRLDVDPYIESTIVWSMTKNSTPIFTHVRSTNPSIAVGLIQFQFERQLEQKKLIRIVSHPTNSAAFISSAEGDESNAHVFLNQNFSEYAQRFYNSFS